MGLNPLLQAKLGGERTKFMIFPEYFFVDQHIKDHKSAVEAGEKGLDWLVELSNSYNGIIIGGSVIRELDGKYYNSTPIIQGGQLIDFYNKRNLSGDEQSFLTAGSEPGIFLLNNIRFGVLINDDLEKDEYFEELAEQGIHLVFSPVTSIKKDGDTAEEQAKRDKEIFAERAAKHRMTIVKCSAVGFLFEQALQGRSLVCTPSGITWRVGPEETDKEISKRVTVVYPRNADVA